VLLGLGVDLDLFEISPFLISIPCSCMRTVHDVVLELVAKVEEGSSGLLILIPQEELGASIVTLLGGDEQE